MKPEIVITKSAEELIVLGEQFALELSAGDVIALAGPLGAGKTTFVQGVAKGLGIAQTVTSPTFVYARQYPVLGRGDIKELIHIDCYRLEDAAKATGIGWTELIGKSDAVTFIEWPEKLKAVSYTYKCVFTVTRDNGREVSIK